ncbi:MAG: methyltransferase domain-containing protein [Planctomycetota bacterium]
MTSSRPEYVLGADERERLRLRHQHQVWRGLSDRLFSSLGVNEGWKVLDAGCGPGLVLEDLRRLVGVRGEAWGVDLTPDLLEEAGARVEEHGWKNVRLIEGDLETLDLPRAYFDLIWMRWVLSFPPRPADILEHLIPSLKPGGCLAVMDYNHDGVGLFPESRGFQAAIRATRKLYLQSGGDPWIGARLPALFREAGLDLVQYDAHARTGGPGQPVFEWASNFFPDIVEKFTGQGLMSPEERDLFHEDWQARRSDPDSRFFSPIIVVAVGRRPQEAP